MSTDKNTIKNWFKTGLKPTQAQFWSTWDSFWHKSESLPISSISGLGKLLDGKAEENHEHNQYATNDATSLTADNVTAWQQKLGVADLKFDDKAITTTQDYADFELQSGATINAFNNAVYEAITGGEFGKNFSNTDLVISENRKHTGTASVELAMPMIYSNSSQRFSGLVDKSSDATYNALLGMDNQGNAGKLAALGNVLESGLQTIPSEQALRIGQLLNGGQGSAGAISVNMISPPLFQKENNNNYIVLRGANLNLNVTDMSVKILRASDYAELATIPNSQIQLMSDGLSLVFYYNFYSLNTGSFKLKITSGVKTYITTLDFTIVNEVTSIDFDAITWNKVIDTAIVTTDNSYGSKGNFLLDSVVSSTKTLPSTSLISSTLFSANDDFYIEVLINTGIANLTLSDIFRMGLCYSTTENSLEFLPFHFFGYNKTGNSQQLLTKVNPNAAISIGKSTSTNSQVLSISFVKISNVVTITDGVQIGTVTISTNSGYRLCAQLIGVTDTCSGQIVKAFKFN